MSDACEIGPMDRFESVGDLRVSAFAMSKEWPGDPWRVMIVPMDGGDDRSDGWGR